MAGRFAWCFAVVAVLFSSDRPARGDSSQPVVLFAGQPADCLAGQVEARPGVAVDLPDAPASVLAKRWNVSAKGLELTAADPTSGLTVVQRRNPVSEPGVLTLRTSLTNRGAADLTLQGVRFLDWSFPVADSGESLRYRPLSHRSNLWYGSTYWSGPDWTRVGKDWHHPGENTPSVRRFQVAQDGRVTITGRVHKAHLDGDGIRAWIVHRGRKVWHAELSGKDSKGVDPNLTLDGRRGDAIRFVVHKLGRIFCDTTYWDPVVTYADGQRFQASTAFSAKKQGADGWFYEMEAGAADRLGLPQVCWLSNDLTLHQQSPGVNQKVQLGHRDTLPLVVVADGADKSGIALALPPDAPWQCTASLTAEGRLRIELAGVGDGTHQFVLKPGQSVDAATVAVAAYRGPWSRGFAAVADLRRGPHLPAELAGLSQRLDDRMRAVLRPQSPAAAATVDRGARRRFPDLDYWVLIQGEWRDEDKIQETAASYAAGTARHLDKARLLLADLQSGPARARFDAAAAELQRLAERASTQCGLSAPSARRGSPDPAATADRQVSNGQGSPSVADVAAARALYLQTRWLKRRIALMNPLFPAGKVLFTKRVPTSYSHLVMQYFGWRARPGGGLCILDEPGRSLACRDILDGELSAGNVLEPRLSWDAKRIVFAFVRCPENGYEPSQLDNQTDDGFYHLYTVNVDGSGLKQLTSGPYDDLMPTWLPDGGVAFTSTRRRGYARCFGGQFSPRWHVYTLHRMDADGRNVRTLSFHDTNEWFPSVSQSGLIFYARWDYIDRDAVTHQNLWATRPDGTNPVAVWGNATPTPHCTFQAQPIPGTSKIVFTAAPHHSIAAGSIAVVDPMAAKDGQAAITRITPEIPFPEAEGRNIQEYYSAPWPLSEKYFLVSYSPKPLVWEPGANDPAALGLYLLDAFGNRELIYRDPEIGSENACPITPRPAPPVVASHLANQTRPTGEMLLADVYQGLGDVRRGTIKQLRIVQIFPKTTNVANSPPIGVAKEENGRAILGTVPVEADGSARFRVPAQRPLLFQALDQDGMAYQTMRSVTYVQPGETVACIGCHEHRMMAPPGRDILAMRRPASRIEPGALGGRPFSFVEVVQPVLDRHCVRCHGNEKREANLDLRGTPSGAYTRSYLTLCGDRDFWGAGTNPQNAAEALVPRFGGRNQIQVTPPGGMYGAIGSRLMKLLRAGHYDAKLPAADLRALGAWIDLNAIFYGVNLPDEQARQLRGELVTMPEIQ